MSEKLENPSAFPQSAVAAESFVYSQGMTLRDYFAAAALQGMLSGRCTYANYENTAYKFANGMLKAREAAND